MRTNARQPGVGERCGGRRGGVYVLVLAVSLLVTVIGVGGVLALQSEREGFQSALGAARGRIGAQSAAEIALAQSSGTKSWRGGVATNGTVFKADVQGGQLLAGASALDGTVLTNDVDAAMSLWAFGRFAGGVQGVRMTLDPVTSRMACLNVPVVSGTRVQFSAAGRIAAQLWVRGYWPGLAAQPTGTLLVVSDGNIPWTSVIGNAAQMPDNSTIFTKYAAMGTRIPIGAIAGLTLQDVLLSPASNPFGTADPQGVYVIDCAASPLGINQVRLVGTLVILNCPKVSVWGVVSFEPAAAAMPRLLVQGDLGLSPGYASLDEATANRNFNPPGTPYQGLTDSTKTTTYAAVIDGIVYASGAVDVTAPTAIHGVLIGGSDVRLTKELAVRYRPGDVTPPGFSVPSGFTVRDGTVARIVE